MNRGGIETWLMNILRNIDRSRFQIDFLVSNSSSSPQEREIRLLGSEIHVCMAHSQPARYTLNMIRLLRRNEPYDVIHSHLHHLNGLVSLIAALSGVRTRIAHSHFDVPGNAVGETLANRTRHVFGRALMRSFATAEVGCSKQAGRALFGRDWERRPGGRVLLCGLDLTPFGSPPDGGAARKKLGIPAGAIVVGHAGRFVPQKNHAWFLDVANQYLRLNPQAHFVLVGDGPLKAEMVRRASSSPSAERFHFTGARDDVPHLMRNVMDCFLLPSLFEGAPLVLVEAQAAGLPCVYSDVIAPETDIVERLLERVSLSQNAREWAAAVQRAVDRNRSSDRALSFAAVQSSAFNIKRAVRELESYYLDLVGAPSAGHDSFPATAAR